MTNDVPMLDFQAILQDITHRMQQETHRGDVATYIPELAKVDPSAFGMALTTLDGQCIVAGDADIPFSIQSISKVFTLTLALGTKGDTLWNRVGREPSGTPFNSIVQLEQEKGIPRNPFINPGAIVVADLLLSGHEPREVIGSILSFIRGLVGEDTIAIDPQVARSETQTGFRNIALANYMRAFDNLKNDVNRTLGVYFHQCAIAMSCRQLARAGLFLAQDGRDPWVNMQVVSKERARRINALMLTCGHYDASGDFAFRVGLPGKSGVGGGILVVAPGKGSLAVWSPGLNRYGNSYLGALALEKFVHATGWSIFSGS